VWKKKGEKGGKGKWTIRTQRRGKDREQGKRREQIKDDDKADRFTVRGVVTGVCLL
jgi:hypothetical protein